jgi:hypothetical protein
LKKLLTVLISVVIFGLSATMVSAKHRNDDPAGDDRGGLKVVVAKHGKDDRGGHKVVVAKHAKDDPARTVAVMAKTTVKNDRVLVTR